MASAIGYITLKSVTIQQHKRNLQNSIFLIELENVENLQEYVKYVSKTSELRVTIISEDGSTLAESRASGLDYLEVMKKVNYGDGSIYIKLSMSLDGVMGEFYSLFLRLFLLFLFAFTLAFFLLKKMNEKIVFDIAQIINYLDEVTNKNYSAVIKIKHFKEFLQISLMLKNLVKRLHSKDKKKTKK